MLGEIASSWKVKLAIVSSYFTSTPKTLYVHVSFPGSDSASITTDGGTLWGDELLVSRCGKAIIYLPMYGFLLGSIKGWEVP